MKKIFAPLALVLALGLSACTNPLSPPQQPPVTVTAEPEAPAQPETPAPEAPADPQSPEAGPEEQYDPVASDAAFRQVMAERFGNDPGVIEATVNLAKQFCTDLSEYTFESLFQRYVNQPTENVSSEDIGYVIGGGVTAYCPQYEPEMAEYFASLST